MNYYERIQKSINYIESNLENSINLDTVASEAYMSQSNFYRMFFALVGHSVKEYIRLRRVSLAAVELMNGNDKLIDLAVKYDFNSRDSFTRAFKRITGFLPSDYRKQQNIYNFEGVNVLDKYYEIQDKNLIKEYPDIKVLKKLEPIRVAYYRTYSKTPENDAFKILTEWARRNGLIDKAHYRVFGFDTPDSKYGDDVYGFEVWMTVDNDLIIDDENVKSKIFDGGLYAVTTTTITDIVKTWDRFREWIKISKYELGNHQYIEEHLPFYEWDKDIPQGEHRVDLYMPIKEKKDKVKEIILPTRVAYYRAEDVDSEKSAMRAWDVMLSWAKSNNLDSASNRHRIFVYNHGFRKTKKYWHEVMITIDDDFDFSNDLVKDKIFNGGNYITMKTNLPGLVDTWKEMSRWKDITKTKAGRHQWVEEWLIEDWKFPERGITVFYPIL